MLRYHVAYHLPKAGERMVVAEVLDFPGVMSLGERFLRVEEMDDPGKLGYLIGKGAAVGEATC